jgi:hypothetical protein
MIILIFQDEKERSKVLEQPGATFFSKVKCHNKDIRIKETCEFLQGRLRSSKRLSKLLKLKIETA